MMRILRSISVVQNDDRRYRGLSLCSCDDTTHTNIPFVIVKAYCHVRSGTQSQENMQVHKKRAFRPLSLPWVNRQAHMASGFGESGGELAAMDESFAGWIFGKFRTLKTLEAIQVATLWMYDEVLWNENDGYPLIIGGRFFMLGLGRRTRSGQLEKAMSYLLFNVFARAEHFSTHSKSTNSVRECFDPAPLVYCLGRA